MLVRFEYEISNKIKNNSVPDSFSIPGELVVNILPISLF